MGADIHHQPRPGLIDDEGYMWRDVASCAAISCPKPGSRASRADQRCLAAGIAPTHIDAHMGAAMLAELLPAHVRLARNYGLFPVLPRSITWAPDANAYRAVLAQLDAARCPVIDHCRGNSLPVGRDELAAEWSA